MSPENMRVIDATLRGMPVEDRLSALLISIIESNPNALAVSLRMVAVTAKMSEGLSVENRFKISEAMRDSADLLERSQIVRIAID